MLMDVVRKRPLRKPMIIWLRYSFTVCRWDLLKVGKRKARQEPLKSTNPLEIPRTLIIPMIISGFCWIFAFYWTRQNLKLTSHTLARGIMRLSKNTHLVAAFTLLVLSSIALMCKGKFVPCHPAIRSSVRFSLDSGITIILCLPARNRR